MECVFVLADVTKCVSNRMVQWLWLFQAPLTRLPVVVVVVDSRTLESTLAPWPMKWVKPCPLLESPYARPSHQNQTRKSSAFFSRIECLSQTHQELGGLESSVHYYSALSSIVPDRLLGIGNWELVVIIITSYHDCTQQQQQQETQNNRPWRLESRHDSSSRSRTQNPSAKGLC